MSVQTHQTIKNDLIVITSPESESMLVNQLQTDFNVFSANAKEEALLILTQYPNEPVLIEQKTICDIVRAELLKHPAGVILLSPTPSFNEGISALQQGFKGYGNLYSHKDRLIAAINLVKTGDVWLGASIIEGLKLQGPEEEGLKQAVSPSHAVDLDKLTPKERAVAKEVVTGLSNKDVAQRLNITERTVKAHLSTVYEKLTLKNRTDLILKYKNEL
jgi:DNA-binding NarL/FixJ family response regulator